MVKAFLRSTLWAVLVFSHALGAAPSAPGPSGAAEIATELKLLADGGVLSQDKGPWILCVALRAFPGDPAIMEIARKVDLSNALFVPSTIDLLMLRGDNARAAELVDKNAADEHDARAALPFAKCVLRLGDRDRAIKIVETAYPEKAVPVIELATYAAASDQLEIAKSVLRHAQDSIHAAELRNRWFRSEEWGELTLAWMSLNAANELKLPNTLSLEHRKYIAFHIARRALEIGRAQWRDAVFASSWKSIEADPIFSKEDTIKFSLLCKALEYQSYDVAGAAVKSLDRDWIGRHPEPEIGLALGVAQDAAILERFARMFAVRSTREARNVWIAAGFAAVGDLENVDLWLAKDPQRGERSDAAYCYLIRGYCFSGQFDRAIEVAKGMSNNHTTVAALEFLVTGACNRGDLAVAWKVSEFPELTPEARLKLQLQIVVHAAAAGRFGDVSKSISEISDPLRRVLLRLRAITIQKNLPEHPGWQPLYQGF